MHLHGIFTSTRQMSRTIRICVFRFSFAKCLPSCFSFLISATICIIFVQSIPPSVDIEDGMGVSLRHDIKRNIITMWPSICYRIAFTPIESSMKLVAVLILACAGICAVHTLKITTWGSITGSVLGTKNIEVSSFILQKKISTFTYPLVNFDGI